MKIFYILSIILLTSIQAKTQQTRINPSQDPVVKFYPNPAVTQITFDFQNGFEKDKTYSFQIFSFIGKKVYEQNSLTSPKTVVNLADFYRGVYIFQIRDKNGKIVESGKFQVAK